MRLYVIGPVSGHEGDNREAFERARRRLEAAGHKAVIPHDLVPADTGWQAAMSKSIREMLRLTPHGRFYYDGVAELPRVIGSKGALSSQPGAKQQSYVCMADLTANAAVDDDLCGTLKVGGSEPIVMAPSFSRRPAQQLPTNSEGLSFALTRGGVPSVCESEG